MNTAPRLLVIATAIALSLSCGGSSDGNTLGPGPVDPTGEWSITYAVTLDTCDAGFVDETLDVELTLSNDGNTVYLQDEFEDCGPVPFPWTGSGFDSYNESYDFMGSDGCTYHDEVTASFTTIGDMFSGEIVYLRTVTAGNNCTNHPAPCEVRESVEMERCNGCYDGCL